MCGRSEFRDGLEEGVRVMNLGSLGVIAHDLFKDRKGAGC